MTLGKNQEAFSKDLTALLNYLQDNNYDVRIGEAERTKEQQEIYIKQGKSKTLDSMHLKRCAIDLHIFKDDNYITSKQELQSIGDYWEGLSSQNRWGGNYKSFIDTPHFERKC